MAGCVPATVARRALNSTTNFAGDALTTLDGPVQVALEVERSVFASEMAVALALALGSSKACVLANTPIRIRTL